MSTSPLRIEWLPRIDAVDAARWNALLPNTSPHLKNPFLDHAFLAALERSGAASKKSGWLPQHLTLWCGDELIAAMPLYLKTHSYGEYVFDWSWADAWQRSGLDYYPKLLCAIPFTPSTGPRVLIADGVDRENILAELFGAIRQRVTDDDLSTFHLLFPDETLRGSKAASQFAERVGVQYHWFNRGYASFEDFLATFASRKRKNLRKERERVAEQGLTLRVLEGAEITESIWRRFHHFYQLTYAKRSGHGGYLGVDFFLEIGRTLRDRVVLVLADYQGETVAGALNFKDGSTLYGRYWGCTHDFEFLHFEACYYQGIDYCIRNGLQHFDPGAQGEHKIQRGFEPINTYSLHWIEHPALRRAVDDFLQREKIDIENYRAAACELLPFRNAN